MSEPTATADEAALLHDLVAIPSVNPGERPAVAYLCEQMAGRGFLTNIDGIGNAIGSVGDGRFHVVLLGHIDTVPGQFPVRIEGDDLYGRGSVDAKGPLATFVAATTRAYERGLLDGVRVTVIGGIGEEAHSPGANFLAETMPAPDACIIGEPGNWESVVLGYKGSMQLRYIRWQPNAHGAGEEKPAPQQAIEDWNAIAAYCEEQNESTKREFDRVTPTLREFVSQSDGIVQKATLNINVRMPPRITPYELLEAMTERMWNVPDERLPALRESWRATGHPIWAESWEREWDQQMQQEGPIKRAFLELVEVPTPAYRCEKNTPLVRSLLAGVRAAWRCQMAAYGPGDSSLDHTPTEHLSLTEYGRAIESLANALGELAAQVRGRSA